MVATWETYRYRLGEADDAESGNTEPNSVSGGVVGESVATNQATQLDPDVSDSPSHRRDLVERYIDEVLEKTGHRITRTEIWKRARYKSRTEFERWERNDMKNPNRTAHERFMRLLVQEKPHLTK